MEVKMEKEPESIATMKPEYAASEYSSASEPPPAYKIRQANSVKIAKIIAFTIIFSSFIMGSFILGSTYLQAKASCDQVQALDAVLDKELMLEALQQELPRSEALQSRELNNNVLQDLSKDEMNKPNEKDETNPDDVEAINTDDINSESDSDSDSDENDLKRVRVKLPLDLDLSDLAHAVLMNNQKSRMNCVVERRRTEEIPENMPFQMFLNEPKKEKVTGERVAIFCETGEPKNEEPQIQVRRIIMPFPFPGQMHRFSPQFPPQFERQNQMNMPPPPPPPQFNPQFNPQFTPQNQMQMPPQMQQQMPFQMRFPPPPMQMNFLQQAPQNMQPQQSPMAQLPPVPAQQMQAPRPDMAQFRLINPMQQQQQQQQQMQQLPNFERPLAQQLIQHLQQQQQKQEQQQVHQLPNFERPIAQQIMQQIQQQENQSPNFERPIAQQIIQQIQQQQERSEDQPEVRIHLRRIQLPGPIGDIFPFLRNINDLNNNNNNKESSEEAPRSSGVQIQQMPLAIALQKVGITADDLRSIQRMAEERFQHEIRELVSDDSGSDDTDSDSDSDSIQSDEDNENGMQTVTAPQTQSSEESQSNQELHEVPAASQQQNEQSLEQKPQILALGRSNFGRSLSPVLIPVPMTQLADDDGSIVQRAAFVQPR